MIHTNELRTSVSPEEKMAAAISKEILIESVFSYCPPYSIDQLRRINNLRTRKVKYGHRNIKDRIHPPHRQYIIKQAFNQEAII
ncbi:MAG TPA: hypothetical protein VH796_00880 [Nitrososphaeraceae archaeon]|jgi:hypothetical protein